MTQPKLSIITVNYNNNTGLQKTIQSVVDQSFEDYEHIIIDANSTDGSLDTILSYSQSINNHLAFWISEPDRGIYDGMNKGIKHAKGEYLYFLNTGDCLNKDVLRQIPFDGTPYIYGDITITYSHEKKETIKSPYPLDPVYLILEGTVCHQACFIHQSLFHRQLYSTEYKIISDWIHIVQSVIFEGCPYKHIPVTITEYDGNGLSTTCHDAVMEERKAWIEENIPAAFADALSELKETKERLAYLQRTELGSIIPLIDHTHKFQKRMKKLILFLYKINVLFSFHRRER